MDDLQNDEFFDALQEWDDTFDEGMQAFRFGYGRDQNPYLRGSHKKAWQKGWDMADDITREDDFQ